MEKKYCILDMDGTIVDSMPYWSTLSPDYLKKKGINENTDELMERIKTMTMPEATKVLKETFHLEETPEEIMEELGEVMRGHYAKDIPLKPGIRRYLESLHDAGARLCIVTATAPPLVKTCLQRLGVWDLFEFVLSCEEVGRGKEYPDAYLEAARRMGAAPDETAVFEDALTALNTAKKAGFYTVAVFEDTASEFWEKCVRTAHEAVKDWEN